ncbi:LPS-assembly protein LptD, partial [Oleiphilus sp. HI0079]|uniref:LPS-assembly protein LptD n=3 Tax=Oleiphilus TaxID=141450 RepID=UPI0018D3E4EB
VHANSVEYRENNRLELEGQVEISKQGYYARSDTAVIDQSKNEAALEGHIVIQGPQMHMTSDSAEVNLTEGSATLHNADFIEPETGLRGRAEMIDQQDELHLTIREGTFTTCQEEVPDWSFSASEIELDQEEGVGSASHARFNILDVPVLYVPWFTFPIDDRRKSGFLYPTIGTSNVDSGLYVSTPYYLNLAPNYDATITPNWIGGRGAYEEVEFR